MLMKLKFIFLLFFIIFTNMGCGGGEDSSSTENKDNNSNIADSNANEGNVNTDIQTTEEILPVNNSLDRSVSKWVVSSTTSSLTDIKTTEMVLSTPSGGGANLHIYCNSKGEKGYYITTDFITASGYVRYRIGDSNVTTEDWIESSNYKKLTPKNIDMSILDKLYKDWDVVFEVDKFGVGLVEINMSNHGFSAAIDKSRCDCNWSMSDLPPDNGWGQEYPSLPPADAIEASYKLNTNYQFRLIAWKATNYRGNQQLLVRLGDVNGPCSGSFLITEDRLYISQNNKKIPVMTGIYLRQSCSSPGIYSLNGNFDVNQPFVLNSYAPLYSIEGQAEPIASITFD